MEHRWLLRSCLEKITIYPIQTAVLLIKVYPVHKEYSKKYYQNEEPYQEHLSIFHKCKYMFKKKLGREIFKIYFKEDIYDLIDLT